MAEHEKMHGTRPQVNISRSTSGRMWLVSFCSFLAILQSALSDSWGSLIIALTALATAILAELLITYKKSGFGKIKDGSAAATALILTLMLPNTIHPVYALIGVLFSIVVVKHSFGGLGSNWLNPALGGWLFLRFSWPNIFNMAVNEGNGVALLSSPIDAAASSFLNGTVFSFLGAQLPAGYINLLFNNTSGLIADRGMMALLAGTIIICAFKVSRSWVPLAYLGVFGAMTFVFGDMGNGGNFFKGDLLFALLSGGTMLAAFILISEPTTSAKSHVGILICTALAGLLTWVFRYPGLEAYGAFFAIALVNALTPVQHYIERRYFYSRGIA